MKVPPEASSAYPVGAFTGKIAGEPRVGSGGKKKAMVGGLGWGSWRVKPQVIRGGRVGIDYPRGGIRGDISPFSSGTCGKVPGG